MSTNINPDNLPDIQELERLANQFFKSDTGNFPTDQQALARLPQPTEIAQPEHTRGVNSPNADFQQNPYEYSHSPKSVAGAGISPSAIDQNNAVNLKDPQTSFVDPNLTPSSSAAGNGTSFFIENPFANGYTEYPKEVKSIQPTSDNRDFGPIPSGLPHLPYQQDQPYESELREVLKNLDVLNAGSQLPFTSGINKPAYYFLENKFASNGSKTNKVGLSSIVDAPFDVNLVRRDFPILQEKVNGHPLVWFDNAATTQKPQQVIDRISYFYEHENSNIHRAAHELAARATDAYEGARTKVKDFLNARSTNEIIFVRGATEAINLVAKSWGEQFLNPGDEIIVSHLEHHANIVPWKQLAQKKGLTLKVIPVDDDGQLLIDEYVKLLGPKTKLVSFTQVSNALGTVTPAAQIVQLAHAAGAKVLVDGAQSVSHMPVDVQALDADWFVFSGHKVFGPTGIGVLYGKEDLLNETQPWQGGGNMIVDVTFDHIQYHNAPGRFEAGTGNIADAVGLGAAIDYVTKLGMGAIALYEHYLLEYATPLLKEVKGLRLIGTAAEKASVLSFVIDGYKTEEIGSILNQKGIAVRSGHHCAQPILRRFGVESTVRPSLAFYNTCAEVDLLVNTLHQLK